MAEDKLGGKSRAWVWISVVIMVIGLGVVGYLLLNREQPEKHADGRKREIILGCEVSILPSIVWIAENKGYFQEEGLNVEIREFGSGKAALEIMLNQENLDMVTAAQTPVVFNSFDRSDYAIIAAMVTSDDDVKVLARQDKSIAEPSDLRGKRVGTTKGSTGHFFLGLFLAHNGIKLSDIEIVDVGAGDLAQALAAGSVDAICTWEPHILNARKLLGEKALVLSGKGIFREDFYFVSNWSFIENSQEIVETFLKAMKRGEEFIQEEGAESRSIVSERLKLDAELPDSIWDAFSFRLMLDQTILITLESEARWAMREGLTDSKEVPNYLNFLYLDALEKIKPEAVTIIR